MTSNGVNGLGYAFALSASLTLLLKHIYQIILIVQSQNKTCLMEAHPKNKMVARLWRQVTNNPGEE